MEQEQARALATFRLEARAWLEANAPRDPRPEGGPAARAFDCAWQRRQFEGGWAGIDWDPAIGGRGLSLLEQIVWYEELSRGGVPPYTCLGVALGHAGPTVALLGDEAQKMFHLPRILRGDSVWCQGFSEPSAGSDLASLRTRGGIDGDHLVVSGQKVWSSWADLADFGELLIRTDPDAPRHKGLSWVIVDMRSPGIDIRPIRTMDGGAEFCEVFYDEVRIPLANVVGGLNNGWTVAMATLANERGPAFLDHRLATIRVVDELLEIARARNLLADQALHDRLATARAEAAAIRAIAYLQVSETEPGRPPGPESTAIRTFYAELQLRVGRLAIDILGAEALTWNRWTQHWLYEFSQPIGGGTTDIQRNIIGERVLGLPR
jgi:alkylation response protein AidB-like acyl-CoA dehydrogenase